jgi:hypothetical protein
LHFDTSKFSNVLFIQPGVQSAEPNLKTSEVTVKGIFDPPTKLVEYVYKRTGKHATIVKTDPPADSAADADKPKDDKKDDKTSDEKKEDDDKKDEKKKEENSGDGEKKDSEALVEEGPADSVLTVKMERMLNELYQHYPKHATGYTPGYAYHQYPPQIFSDENPNACAIM